MDFFQKTIETAHKQFPNVKISNKDEKYYYKNDELEHIKQVQLFHNRYLN